MNRAEDIFFDMPCLTEKSSSVSGMYLSKKWFKRADRRYIGEILQKFINYNKDYFNFIGVEAFIDGFGRDVNMSFKSGKYVGAIPLRAPDSGKQIGDFVVMPRYLSSNNDYSEFIEVINLIEKDITPEFMNSIPLMSGENVRPPLYLEALKYIYMMSDVLKANWRKFYNTKKLYTYPKANIDWKEYINKEYDPYERLIYPCRDNILTNQHDEFLQLVYVYYLAKNEIYQASTPKKIRYEISDNIDYLDTKLYGIKFKITDRLVIHNSDAFIIKGIKEQGNKLLLKYSEKPTSWRIDFSLVFEKFVQYIFREVSMEIGAKEINNYKIRRISSNFPKWSLKYLEPDIALLLNEKIIFVDAKYKSHVYNLNSESEVLKDEHRKDIHQILGYCSFDKSTNKIGFLCYPSNNIYFSKLEYLSEINILKNTIYLLGMPINRNAIKDIKKVIMKNINDCVFV